jgi:hypothetical protein
MLRRLVRLTCFASALLCLCTLALWVRGAKGPTYVELVAGGRSLRLDSVKGSMGICYTGDWPEPDGVYAAAEVWNKTAYMEPRPKTWISSRRVDVPLPGGGGVLTGRCTVRLAEDGSVLRRRPWQVLADGQVIELASDGTARRRLSDAEAMKLLPRHDYLQVYPESRPLPFAMITLPHWRLATMFAAPLLIWPLRRFRRRRIIGRRRRLGLCEACGYNLLGSSGRRPECGKCF